jgi:tetratricopeptide (TPR) repeat protein
MDEWNQAEQHAQRAHQLYEMGQWDKALAELRLALAFDPNQSDWHFGMGLTLDALQRFDEAIASYERVIKLRGEDVETLLYLGVDLVRTDHPRRAIEQFERAAAIDPHCHGAFCHRILAHARLGEHDEAEVMFYLAKQMVDECPACYDHLAQSLEARGMLERALWCWQQSLKLEPHFPDVHLNLARVHRRLDQPDRSQAAYLGQLRETPGDIQTILELGDLLVSMEQYGQAAEKFRRVLELDNRVAQAHLALGRISLMMGHFDAALTELRTADQLDASIPGVHLAIAQLMFRRGDRQRALSHLRIELDRTGHGPNETLDIAGLAVELRNPAIAIELLDTLLAGPDALRLSRIDLAAAYMCRGGALLLMGQTTSCLRDCRRSLKITPENYLAMQNLALVYTDLHRFKRAGMFLRRAAAIRPDSPDLLQLRVHLFRVRCAWVFRRLLGGH